MAVPYTFGSATSSIPLSQLDSNFATAITLGNTAVYLGNTTTTLNALTLSNVTISSGNVTITSVTITNANITGTTTLSGLTASTALALDASKNIVSVTNTGTGNNVLAASPSLTGTVTIATLNLTNALGTTYGGTGLTSFTANGVVYASSSSALTTGSALVFDGTNLGVANSSPSDAVTVGTTTTGKNIRIYSSSNGNNGLLRMFDSGGTERLQLGVNTTGEAVYYSPTSSAHAWYINTEQMRLTSTGLGIGTSSPTEKLHVAGALRVTGAQTTAGTGVYLDQTSGTGGVSVYGPDNSTQGTFRVYTATANGGTGSTKLTLDSSGNLGLGVTPSAWATIAPVLQLPNGNYIGSQGSVDTFYVGQNHFYNGTNFKYVINGYATQYQLGNNNGTHQWKIAPTGVAGNNITFTTAMTLGSNGFLGIGQTSPAYPLDISTGANAAQIAFQSTISSGTNFKIAQGIQGVTNSGMQIYDLTNSAVRLAIDNSGNLLVGTTSALGKFTVANGTAVQYTGVWQNNNVGLQYFHSFDYSGTQIGSISGNNTITLYNTTSDYRLKTVVGAVTGQGARIDSLEPIEYTWNADGSRTRGFLAHQFQEVYASSVTGTKDAVDAQGKPIYQAMQASSPEVIADLVAEIQSLRKRLADAGI